jgi:hypothetical protein
MNRVGIDVTKVMIHNQPVNVAIRLMSMAGKTGPPFPRRQTRPTRATTFVLGKKGPVISRTATYMDGPSTSPHDSRRSRKPGEVVVSGDVAQRSASVRFEDVGLVTLQGVASLMRLFPRDAVIVGTHWYGWPAAGHSTVSA